MEKRKEKNVLKHGLMDCMRDKLWCSSARVMFVTVNDGWCSEWMSFAGRFTAKVTEVVHRLG